MNGPNIMRNEPGSDRAEGNGNSSLGEGSTIKIGLALILASYIALSSWWASAMNSKLSVIVSGQQQSNGDVASLRQKVEGLERVADQFVQFGSPALRVRIEALEKAVDRLGAVGSPKAQEVEKRVSALEREFEIHKTKP